MPAANDTVNELLKLPVMTLATCSPAGQPHAASVYFAALESFSKNRTLRLVFFSAPESRHSQDIAAHPTAAGEIHAENHSWREIQGLQLHGEVQSIESKTEWEQGWQVYLQKFPFVSGLKIIVQKNKLYCFSVHWLRLVDNRRRFGFKQEWESNDQL
jgi:uncharacterized protein YhbP (UPF0306 family)